MLILLVFLLASHIYASKDTNKLQKVRLQLKWKHQFQFAGFYSAIEKGYFRELGIEVELLELDSIETWERVFAGDAEFGIGTSDIILAKDKGYEPVILAPIFQHSPLVLLTSKASGIINIHQLAGKKIMVEPHSAEIYSFLEEEGIDRGMCTLVPHTFNMKALMNGEVDAITSYACDEPYELDMLKFEYNILYPISAGIDFYGDLLFTSKKLMETNPTLVSKFRQASLKGWQYALMHQQEMIEYILKKYPHRRNKAQLTSEANLMRKYMMSDVVEVGYSNKLRWNQIAKTYKKLGFIQNDIDFDGMFYEDYKKVKTPIPWLFIFAMIAITSLIATVAYFFFRLSQRLRKEIKKNLEDQMKLQENEAELRELNSTKDKFFSIISHDLRSPMSSFKSITQLLYEEFDSFSAQDKLEYLELMKSSSANLYSLLDNLLEWSRSQRGLLDFEPYYQNLSPLVDRILDILKVSSDAKKVKIHNTIAKEQMLYADLNMLNSIIRNLVSNAIKFSNIGKDIEIGISTEYSDSSSTTLFVKDYGVGMPKSKINKLFRIDENVSTLGTINEKGTGIGLILCKEFVDRHKGRIWVESEENIGTSFFVSFPNNI